MLIVVDNLAIGEKGTHVFAAGRLSGEIAIATSGEPF